MTKNEVEGGMRVTTDTQRRTTRMAGMDSAKRQRIMAVMGGGMPGEEEKSKGCSLTA